MQAIDHTIITLAHRMADTAGEIARRYFRTGLNVENKADASPVTLADREIETALRALIEEHYPSHGIVGEEFGNVRADSPLQWVIDPIDGTRAFIAGIPTFTTLIALVKDGTPILGIIDQPITKERWVGIEGQKTEYRHPGEGRDPRQATRTLLGMDHGLRRDDKKTLSQAHIATTSMDYFTPQQAAVFEQLKNQCAEVTYGGDAYLYGVLASGKYDIVIDAGLKPYDFCALAPVIEGAGGIITDWNGKPITLASDGRVIAAANKKLHAAVTICQ